jgi:hypothetical protein
MIYARQHPNLPGSFAGPDYEWAPAGCERQWCGGCGTCEAKTSWGYLLGRPAHTCADVPCDGTQDYVCTLDGGTKQCYPGHGWLSSPPPPPPVCDPGNCAEYDYVNCVCLRA